MNNLISLIIFLILYVNYVTCPFSKEERKKYLEGLSPIFEKLNITPNDKNQIDLKSLTKIIKYIFGGIEATNKTASSPIEDEFIFFIIKKLLIGLPDYINVEDIPDILDPEKLETLTNDMLKNFRTDKIQQEVSQRHKKEKANKNQQHQEKKENEEKNVKMEKKEDIIDL